ncbi:proteasome complex subunit Rpn13 ubiquitin receptor-domain-containing protein [Sporodiniella umbellata]|nr:proteasome complex subunit Rpn13 ubiquitin receptor-domain-containing protein [Sporodiniella umbellata]
MFSKGGPFYSFNAGKCIVEGNLIKPDLRKGTLYFEQCNEDLLHLRWKERGSEQAEDDFVVYQDEAKLTRVNECTTGRVYKLVLKRYKKRCFYWMQSKSEENDQKNVERINETIGVFTAPYEDRLQLPERVEDPDLNLTDENVLEYLQNMDRSERSRPQTEEPGKDSRGAQPDYSRLAQMLTQNTTPNQQTPSAYRPIALADILNTSSISPLLNDPAVCTSLFPYLPETMENSSDELRQVISSPQFSQALQSLTVALETGQLGPLLSQFGLDASAFGVEAFLNAIQKQSDNKKQDRMEE